MDLSLILNFALLAYISSAISIPFSQWTCIYGTCIASSGCGMNGGECIKLNATASTYSSLQSPHIPQANTPFSYWMLTAYAKCSGVTPYFSFAGASITYSTGPAAAEVSGWTRYEFISRIPGQWGTKRIVLGLYQAVGNCLFSDVSVSPAELRPFTFSPYGLLGRGETISGGIYTSSWGGGGSLLTNYARPLISFNSSYMSGAFRIYTSHILLMNHTLNIPFTSNPKVTTVVGNYYTGYVLIEASHDSGSTWEIFGNITSTGTVTANFPSPSYSLVRLRGLGPSGSGVHVSSYTFEAGVTSSGADVSGRDVVIVTDSNPSTTSANLSISLHNSVSTYTEYSETSTLISLPLYVTSESTSTSTVSPTLTITPRFSTSTMAVSPSTISTISPSSTISTILSYKLSSGKPEISTFILSDSTNTYITGRILFGTSHILLETTYGELLSASSSSSLWWCDSNRKISMHRSVPTTTSTKISISAARNEREPFQLVIRSKSSPITINSISVADLSNGNGATLSSSAFTIRREMYLKTKMSSGGIYGLPDGYWADPLIPLDLPYTCKSETNCPFWVHVHVPSDQNEGDYSGSISVLTSTGTLSSTLQLHVYNFSIPKHTKLKSRFGVRHEMAWRYHHLNASSPNTDKEAFWIPYLKDFEEHRLSPQTPHLYHGFDANLVLNTTTGIYNWAWSTSTWERDYKNYYDPDIGMGFPSYERGLVGMNGGTWHGRTTGTINGYSWGTPEHTRLFKSYALGFQNELVKTNMIEKTMVSWFDEPLPKDYDYVKEGMTAIKNAAPLLKRFLTQAPDEALYGYVDVWCSDLQEYNQNLVKARQVAGDSVWIYGFSTDIDYPLMKIRMMLWFVAKNNLDGILIWAPNIWTNDAQYPDSLQDPYSDTMSWSDKDQPYSNGEARLFYPPLNWNKTSAIIFEKPVDSIRWEIITEGVEDWEYYQLLKEASKRIDLTTQRINKINDLLNIPSSFMYDQYFYTENPDTLIERRKAMANVLEELETTPGSSETFPSNHGGSNGGNGDASSAFKQSISFVLVLFIVFVFVI